MSVTGVGERQGYRVSYTTGILYRLDRCLRTESASICSRAGFRDNRTGLSSERDLLSLNLEARSVCVVLS